MFRGAGWKIAVYGRDHGIPHFHIEGRVFDARYPSRVWSKLLDRRQHRSTATHWHGRVKIRQRFYKRGKS
jgi:hypothetical protein